MATKVIVTKSYLSDIANALRDRFVITETFKVKDMGNKIREITTIEDDIIQGKLITDDYTNPRVTKIDSTVFSQNYETNLRGGNYSFPNVKSIAETKAFYRNRGISIDLPKLTSVSNEAFSNSYFETINVPQLTTFSKSAFYNCVNLTTLNALMVKTIESTALRNCSSLQSIDFPLVTKIGGAAFMYSGITTANFPNLVELPEETYDGGGGHSKGSQFCSCESLTEARFDLIETISTGCFSSCRNLTSFYGPMVKTVNNYGFYSSGLTAIDSSNFPNLETINNSSFSYCKNLRSVKLSGAASLEQSCFSNCSQLEYVDLNDVSKLSYGMFPQCPNLKAVIIRLLSGGTAPSIYSNYFTSTPLHTGYTGSDTIGYLYVPRAYYENYTSLSDIRVRVLEDYTIDGTTTGELDPNKI